MYTFCFAISHQLILDSAKTTEVDAIRFQDKDLHNLGTLERGQFGIVSKFLPIKLGANNPAGRSS